MLKTNKNIIHTSILLFVLFGFLQTHAMQNPSENQTPEQKEYKTRIISTQTTDSFADTEKRDNLPLFQNIVSLLLKNNNAEIIKQLIKEGTSIKKFVCKNPYEINACTICRIFIQDLECISITPCNHIFHPQCIGQSLKQNKRCPECRTSLKAEDVLGKIFEKISIYEIVYAYNNIKLKNLRWIGYDVKKENLEKLLVVACEMGNDNLASELIKENSINIHVKDEKEGFAPFNWAISKKMSKTIDELLKIIPLVNTKGKNNTTPLIYACFVGDKNTAIKLIERGADVNAKDNEHNTPIVYASAKKQDELIQFLILHGAQVNHENKKKQSPFTFYPNTTKFGKELSEIGKMQYHLFENIKNIETPKDSYAKEQLKKIVYNHQFLLNKEFEKAKNFAIKHNIKDKLGKTVLQAVLFYLTGYYKEDRNKFLSRYFGKYKSSTLNDIENSIKYLEKLKWDQQLVELWRMQRAWYYLAYKKDIPHEVVGKIVHFAGVTSFRDLVTN